MRLSLSLKKYYLNLGALIVAQCIAIDPELNHIIQQKMVV